MDKEPFPPIQIMVQYAVLTGETAKRYRLEEALVVAP